VPVSLATCNKQLGGKFDFQKLAPVSYFSYFRDWQEYLRLVGAYCLGCGRIYITSVQMRLFNADPDPTFHLNLDPDPAPHQRDANLRPQVYPFRALV
jgi:hypothetical protein